MGHAWCGRPLTDSKAVDYLGGLGHISRLCLVFLSLCWELTAIRSLLMELYGYLDVCLEWIAFVQLVELLCPSQFLSWAPYKRNF